MTAPWRIAGVVFVVALGGGLALAGASFRRTEPIRHAPAPSVASAEAKGPVMAMLTPEDRVALQVMMRKELESLSARTKNDERGRPTEAQGDEPKANKDSPSISDLDSVQLGAYDQGRSKVEGAIARGTWAEADREELHKSIEGLPMELQLEIARPLVAAMNREQIRFSGNGPAF